MPLSDLALTGYRLLIRELVVEASIGVYDFEKEARQKVSIDIDLYVQTPSIEGTDNLDDVVNYELLHDDVITKVQKKHYHLAETLVVDLAELCMAHPMAQGVRVRLQKPDVFLDCRGVGVEVIRRR